MPGRPVRRRRQRKVFRKKAPTTKNLSKRIKHIENGLIELKYYDSVLDNQTFDQSGLVLPVSITPSGTGESERVGDSITTTSFRTRLALKIPFGTTPTSVNASLAPRHVRIILFWDKQNNASPTALLFGDEATESLLLSYAGFLDEPYLYQYNHTNAGRYKILYDKVHTINPDLVHTWTNPATGTADTAVQDGQKNVYIQFVAKTVRQIKYATDTAPSTNACYLAFLANRPTTATDKPIVSSVTRMYYKDA